MDNPGPEFQPDPADAGAANDHRDMQRLRELLFGLEHQQLIALKARLEDWRQRADDIAQVLPQAFHTSVNQSPALVNELTSVIEEAIQESVRRNPKALVDAIFPILGPAIRKAIRTTLHTMLQSLNQTIEQGLTIRALSWRFRAWRSGKSYAEYLVLKTMLYQVEQVFMIHNETGLLLKHAQAENMLTKDPDMVSGMLSAIQEFVRDSFQGEDSDILESMQFGDMTVMLEAGPDVVIALVVSGKPPASLKQLQIEVIEAFQLRYAHDLSGFDGNTTVFDSSTDLLQDCLVNQRLEQEKGNRSFRLWRVWLLVITVMIILSYWQFGRYTRNQQWQAALGTLREEPGVIVINSSKEPHGYKLQLLVDPLARDPETILSAFVESIGPVDISLSPFISLERHLILERAGKKLQPPPGIEMHTEKGVLYLTGVAEKRWLNKVATGATSIDGIHSLDFSAVSARINEEEIAELKSKINRDLLYFEEGQVRLEDADREALTEIAAAMIRLEQIVKQQGGAVNFVVTGHSDLSGTGAIRQEISSNRARTAYDELRKYGVNADRLSYTGAGTQNYREDLVNNRRVSFHVITKNSRLNEVDQDS
jgi:OOP family OmpA-OmpF porin